MSHLDTAFKLGAAQAEHDFSVELNKIAQGADPTAAAMAPIRSMLAGAQGPGGAAPAPAARPAPVVAKPAVQNVPPPRFGAGGAAPGAAGPAAGGMQLQQPALGGGRPTPGAGALSPGKLQLR